MSDTIRDAYEDALRMLDANEPAADALSHFARAVFAEGEQPADVEVDVASDWIDHKLLFPEHRNGEGELDGWTLKQCVEMEGSLARLLADQRRGRDWKAIERDEAWKAVPATSDDPRERAEETLADVIREYTAEVRRLRAQAEERAALLRELRGLTDHGGRLRARIDAALAGEE